ncbi:MAG: hypothetical protein KIT17_11655 [Rubrivivax sp.]|nr:hypothetical protein [Rubrivivax sp.]
MSASTGLLPLCRRTLRRLGARSTALPGAVLLAACAQPGDPAHVHPGGLPLAVRQALAAANVPAESLAAVALPLEHRGPGWVHRAGRPMQGWSP